MPSKPNKNVNFFSRYWRLTRSNELLAVGVFYLPCVWGVFFGYAVADHLASSFPYKDLLILLIGALFARAAGCVFNDITDKSIDAKVTRTAMRPLAANEVSIFKAYITLALMLFPCALIWTFYLGNSAKSIALLAILSTIIYSYAKRFTHYPQIFSGLAINIGVPVGYISQNLPLTWHVLPLYGAALCWTMVYNHIYSHQDLEDDIKLGLKSTAILFIGHRGKVLPFVAAFYALLLITAFYSSVGFLYYIFSSLAAALLFLLLYKANLNSPSSCKKFFYLNNIVGLLVAMALLLGNKNIF